MLGKHKQQHVLLPVFFIILIGMPGWGWAEIVDYELTIAQEMVSIADATAEGMTINGGIPGPTLRFKEGDTARIQVHNGMTVATSIHWHGLLVPPGMDGVPYISFPPIQPGATFTYEFPIRQSGTYWYHSHSNLQEQRGVYGAIVIEPKHSRHKVDNEHVILFSDWTREDPHKILRTLKRGSEWYAIEKGSSQSIIGAARVGKLGDYFSRELQRMPAMDIADVAYDYFLANGQPETGISAMGGDLVRLRIVNGSATTYFHLEFAGGPMTIISADGQEVQPTEQQRFLIAVAETYDVLVRVPFSGSYELRATAHDASGYASVWLGSGDRFPASDIPKPNLYQSMQHGSVSSMWALTPAGVMGMTDEQVAAGRFDKPGMINMQDMPMQNGHGMGQGTHMSQGSSTMQAKDEPMHNSQNAPAADMSGSHEMTGMKNIGHAAQKKPAVHDSDRQGKKYAGDYRLMVSDVSSGKDLAADGMGPKRPWPPYAKLRAIEPTVFDANKPVRDIRLTLDGDMERYVWFLNKKPLSESDVIQIQAGEVVRFIMINRTMMHHPMHLHGHFFRVINGQDDNAPLKHTVDVAPMSTTVIEFAANEFGDWFFHCHLLYHMKSGMARVIHYDNYQPDPEVAAIQSNLFKESWYAWGEADVLSNMTEGALTLADTRNIFKAQWEAGWQNVDETDWEGLFTYDRYLNRFSSIFVGADILGEGYTTEDSRGVLGIHYLLPLNFETRVWVDSDGGARVTLEKEFTLTPRLALIGEVEYDTHDRWEGKTGLSYTLFRNVSLLGQWHSEFGWGGGVQVRF
ncbi:MAG: multicopper oxidase domain-containing protein [Desulfobacterales bacterium]|nr:multicopper oxidase domain-containing protein [Desulfobacterales bacterium]MDX2512332.1 multicopper oxidase domain-containing protein [Desulfobacterales bacterium]